jgi:superoxide dismutase
LVYSEELKTYLTQFFKIVHWQLIEQNIEKKECKLILH